ADRKIRLNASSNVAFLALNGALIKLRRSMLSSQMSATLRPPVDLDQLIEASRSRGGVLTKSDMGRK
ncbi:MAG: hypothetical protein ACI8V4_003745, partial [Ilumatobacter sp.]